jgi:V/A-type H+-transporting ATPase subunit E
MGLEAVVDEIREKGKREAERIRTESIGEVDRILGAARRRVEETKQAADAEIAGQVARFISQEVSAANLIVKRELLNTQKQLLDEVFKTALAEISGLPESFHREALQKLLSDAKKEIPKGTVYCNARDAGTLKEIIAKSREFAGFSIGPPVTIEGGIIVEGVGGELQIDYSYKTFLTGAWDLELKNASDILFG